MVSKIALEPSMILLILFRKKMVIKMFPYSLYELRLQLYGRNILKWTYRHQIYQMHHVNFPLSIYETKYSRIDLVKFVEDSLQIIWSSMVCISSLPQILLGPFLNTLSHSDAGYEWVNHSNQILFKHAIYPDGIYLLRVNNRNTRNQGWNIFKVNNKDTGIVLVSLLLTLDIFHTFF